MSLYTACHYSRIRVSLSFCPLRHTTIPCCDLFFRESELRDGGDNGIVLVDALVSDTKLSHALRDTVLGLQLLDRQPLRVGQTDGLEDFAVRRLLLFFGRLRLLVTKKCRSARVQGS